MPEFRKDLVRGEWVIIATERAKRPEDFTKNRQVPPTNGPKVVDGCFFCEGHEKQTPAEVLAYPAGNRKPNQPGWQVRVFPNKFPALIPGQKFESLHHEVYHVGQAIGWHEIIATVDHSKPPALFSSTEMEMMIRAYEERFQVHCSNELVKYVLIIYNHGQEAGASLAHPHSQLFAIPVISNYLRQELDGAASFYRKHQQCVFCRIIENEVKEAKKQRVVFENEGFIALCPYASQNPFEVWILPRRHNPFFQIVDYMERVQLGECLRAVLKKYYVGLDNPPFNYYIQSAPSDGQEYNHYHWHLEILPHLTTRAGFEYGTGIMINVVKPEDAAKFLRETKI